MKMCRGQFHGVAVCTGFIGAGLCPVAGFCGVGPIEGDVFLEPVSVCVASQGGH